MQLEARVSVCDTCFAILQSCQSVYLYFFEGFVVLFPFCTGICRRHYRWSASSSFMSRGCVAGEATPAVRAEGAQLEDITPQCKERVCSWSRVEKLGCPKIVY